jgi:hypothetical protein
MINKRGAVREIKIGRGNGRTRRKPVPLLPRTILATTGFSV